MRKLDHGRTVSAVNSTTGRFVSSGSADRRIPSWAAALVSRLARDEPAVVTRTDIAARLEDLDAHRDADSAVEELRRLGWLVGLPVKGTWAFIPPGQEAVSDPYLPIRAWRAIDRRVDVMLAGAAAAWHLGYVDRAPDGPVPIWIPKGLRLPDGLRSHVTVVSIDWSPDLADELLPSKRLLLRRKLDIVDWAGGLPAFGPEALVVQLSSRPASFAPWADLVPHLGQLVEDVEERRLALLLRGQSASAWQRAAYLIHAGGEPARALRLFEERPRAPMPKVHFSHPSARSDEAGALWVPQYKIVDRLIAPLQGLVGKA